MAAITDITVHFMAESHIGRLVAYADITLDHEIKIRGIRIIRGTCVEEERYFVQFPRVDSKRSSSNDVVHPISPEARRKYEKAVVDAYHAKARTRYSYATSSA